MRALAVGLGALVLLAPAAKKPKLVLKGPRVVMMRPTGFDRYAPATVRVRARLEGDLDDPEKYYCLTEVWEWGDDTESTYEPDCDPYAEGAEVKRNFSASRQYRFPGSYTVRLHLKRGKETVISGSTRIRISGG